MYFKIKLDLESNQKVELYKLGVATKHVYNTALQILSTNYVDNNNVMPIDELFKTTKIKCKSIKETTQFNFSVFIGAIKLAQYKYEEFADKKGRKPYKEELNEFDFTIYLENSDVVLKRDGLIILNKNILPSIKNTNDYFLRSARMVGIQGAKDYKNFKIVYDGVNYYFQGDRIPYKKDKHYGVIVQFLNKHFIQTSDGTIFEPLTKDDGFMNKCLLILDLEETLRNNGKLTNQENKSLDFARKRVRYIIDSYVDSIVDRILLNEPQFICIATKDEEEEKVITLSTKINNYLVKVTRNVLFRRCTLNNIDYFVMPQKNIYRPEKRYFLKQR